MTNERQKPVTDHYRSAWDQIFGAKPTPADQKEQTLVDKPAQDQ
jgi:hypothetical protein